MPKNKEFPQEVFVTREKAGSSSDDYFLASDFIEAAYDNSEETDGGQVTIATYKLVSVESVKRELKRARIS